MLRTLGTAFSPAVDLARSYGPDAIRFPALGSATLGRSRGRHVSPLTHQHEKLIRYEILRFWSEILSFSRDILCFGPFRTQWCTPFYRISLRKLCIAPGKLPVSDFNAVFAYGLRFSSLWIVSALWAVDKGASS